MVELAIRQKIVRFYELDGNLIEVGTPASSSIFLCCSIPDKFSKYVDIEIMGHRWDGGDNITASVVVGDFSGNGAI